MAWGEKYILEAVKSRNTALAYDHPAILITDQVSADFARRTNGFDEIVVASFEHSKDGHGRKSELWRWLPEQYDTFLFIDTDTRILGDIGLGFEKAESHGLALVPAAHYCLDHFWGFRNVMEAVGVEPRGQLQYNSGVIFFQPTPAVVTLLKKWNELMLQHEAPWDQPFLTLAIELMDFRPYILSMNYNYRGLGVPLIGPVRIWHTPHEPPADINAEPDWWPMRYFVDGKLHRPGYLRKQIKTQFKQLLRVNGSTSGPGG